MKITKITQIDESHCGPAVLAMMLDALGIEVGQEEIAEAAGVEDVIDEHGMRIDQLAVAASKVAPTTRFWYKYQATLGDLRYLLNRGYVVGVEWQGLFYKSEEEEEEEEDPDEADFGHYSIVTFIDDDQEALIIVDPYKDFARQDRILPLEMFERRWWDTNEVRDPITGRRRIEYDDHVLFFVAPQEEEFPSDMGFVSYMSAT